MERPKTYGEFAEMNEYTRVDERLATGSHPSTDKGCIEVCYVGQQEPTLITDNMSRYDRLTTIADVIEYQMEQIREMASDDLKELKAEKAMEQ